MCAEVLPGLQLTQNLVSVIVPTKNSERFLPKCLSSIKSQTYSLIEVIVVDNFSVDSTQKIARASGARVIEAGPERSSQVNFGVHASHGTYVFRVDSDFVLESTVIQECVELCDKGLGAVVVHNTPDQRISRLAKLRKFEVDMYKYDLTHSAARFFRKTVFDAIGGYNPQITAGEDYDIQNRLHLSGVETGFAASEALHLGEPVDLLSVLKKYMEYGVDFVNYMGSNREKAIAQLGPLRIAYIKRWRKFMRHPILGVELIIYHSMRFVAGLTGYIIGHMRLTFGKEESTKSP